MSEQTANIGLPYILPSQAQKHVTHNEALRVLDAIVHLSILDRHLAAPPASPTDGERYIVAAAPTGAWGGHAGSVAAWQDGVWNFYPPEVGWLAWIADEDDLVAFDGSGWVAVQRLHNLPMLGVNATADTGNRLSVRSAYTLFDNIGNGHQQKLNKAASGDTASLMFQTGYSGRAEFGTTGDDNFHVKVSPDGSAWTEALVIDKATGYVGMGTASPDARFTLSANASPAPGTLPGGTVAHFVGATGGQSRFVFDSFAEASSMAHRRANGTPAAPAALALNDLIGGYMAYGHDGSGYSAQAQASMSFMAEEDWTPTASGCLVSIFTTAPGGTTSSEKMRVTGSGNVGIGTTSPAVKLDVDGPARIKSYTVAGLPAASAGAGQIVMVSDETGGAVLAFSDGTNWRRVTDRAVVS